MTCRQAFVYVKKQMKRGFIVLISERINTLQS